MSYTFVTLWSWPNVSSRTASWRTNASRRNAYAQYTYTGAIQGEDQFRIPTPCIIISNSHLEALHSSDPSIVWVDVLGHHMIKLQRLAPMRREHALLDYIKDTEPKRYSQGNPTTSRVRTKSRIPPGSNIKAAIDVHSEIDVSHLNDCLTHNVCSEWEETCVRATRISRTPMSVSSLSWYQNVRFGRTRLLRLIKTMTTKL
jgi:hypothetical protein